MVSMVENGENAISEYPSKRSQPALQNA